MTYNKGTNQFSDLLESEWLALVPGCRINVTSSSGHGDKHARRGRVSTRQRSYRSLSLRQPYLAKIHKRFL